MEKNIFVGTGTALVTPFRRDGKVDWDALAWLLETQITGGVNFLVPCGTTGESPTLSHEEQDQVIAFVKIHTCKLVPILAGTGSNSTAEAVRLTRAAREIGVEGALVVSPYYNKPTQQGLKLHYREIAKVGLPIVLYDIPGRCGGQGVSAETILELAHEGTICGLKWASGNLDQLQEILVEPPENFSILSGDDNRTFEAMSMGASGVISVLSNLMPEKVVSLVCDIKNGWSGQAKIQHDELLEMMTAMFIETNPIPVKTALAMVHSDIFKEVFRLPLCEMEASNKAELKKVLQNYFLLPK